MKLRLILVGRDRKDPLVEAANEYLDRVRHHFEAELIEVKEEPAKASTPVARIKSIEAERLDKALGKSPFYVALDERGRQLDSLQLADAMRTWADEGRSLVSFVIGGPNGLDESFVRRADSQISLSKMTLPHRLARVVLCEQLYRACTILKGQPYHK